jgi:DNA-binding NtrC family response regulator
MNAPALEPRHRVLIAEDNVAMRELLTASFMRAGFQVDTVCDGRELKENLNRALDDGGPPRVVVSDICMPGASGLEVLQWLRKRISSAQVVLITAFGDTRTHERAKQLGAVAVLDKPFDIQELLALVSDLVADEGSPS